MKGDDFNKLKKGDHVMHKHFGECEVQDFVVWDTNSKSPILLPITDDGKAKLSYFSGVPIGTPVLEDSKYQIQLMPGKERHR